MKITENDILEIYKKHKDEINPDTLLNRIPNRKGCYREIESKFLYSFIRWLKPKKIIEMSPENGWTTLIMIKACQKNKKKCKILSYDIRKLSNKFNVRGKYVTRKFILGDVRETLEIKDVKECDFFLIDCDHSGNFGKWYSLEILPHLKEDTIIFIHDWPGYKAKRSPIPYYLGNEEPSAVKECFILPGHGKHVTNTTDLAMKRLLPSDDSDTEIIQRTDKKLKKHE